MSGNKYVTIFKYSFLIIGICILVISCVFVLNTQRFLKTAVETQGVVVDIHRSLSRSRSHSGSRIRKSTTYLPVVEFYTADDQSFKFTSSSGSNPPRYSRGEKVTVLYQTSSPEQAKIKSFFPLWGGVLITGIIGSAFFSIGCSIILFGFKKNKNIEKLMQNGTLVNAKYVEVRRKENVKMNGRVPYQILAQWQNPTTGEVHVFNSENLWYDPTDYITSEKIAVLVDMKNPNSYHLDTDFLPKLAN